VPRPNYETVLESILTALIVHSIHESYTRRYENNIESHSVFAPEKPDTMRIIDMYLPFISFRSSTKSLPL
jgi:hypothetical protein